MLVNRALKASEIVEQDDQEILTLPERHRRLQELMKKKALPSSPN